MDFLYLLENFRSPVLDIFFQLITMLAQEMVIVGLICLLYWCLDKKLAYTLGFSFFLSGISVQALKITFRIPRPWTLDPSFHPVESAVAEATGYSFPSGHTQSAGSLYGTLLFHFKNRCLKVLCLTTVLLIGFSRMYLGVHTPKDVFVSLVISIAFSMIIYHYLYKKENIFSTVTVSIVFLVVSLLLIVYAGLLYRSHLIEFKYAQDCFKTSGAGAAFALGYYIEKRFLKFDVPKSFLSGLLRFLIGILIAVILLSGLKQLLGTSFAGSFFRYFICLSWILFLYPMIFKNVKHL